jgi:hypothetical protein
MRTKKFNASQINTRDRRRTMRKKKILCKPNQHLRQTKNKGKKNLIQTKSTPETDKEQGGKKRSYANQINT